MKSFQSFLNISNGSVCFSWLVQRLTAFMILGVFTYILPNIIGFIRSIFWDSKVDYSLVFSSYGSSIAFLVLLFVSFVHAVIGIHVILDDYCRSVYLRISSMIIISALLSLSFIKTLLIAITFF